MSRALLAGVAVSEAARFDVEQKVLGRLPLTEADGEMLLALIFDAEDQAEMNDERDALAQELKEAETERDEAQKRVEELEADLAEIPEEIRELCHDATRTDRDLREATKTIGALRVELAAAKANERKPRRSA